MGPENAVEMLHIGVQKYMWGPQMILMEPPHCGKDMTLKAEPSRFKSLLYGLFTNLVTFSQLLPEAYSLGACSLLCEMGTGI